MRKISYSGKKIKYKKIASKTKKKEAIVQGKKHNKHLEVKKDLKIINVLYGGDLTFNTLSQPNYIHKEVKYFLKTPDYAKHNIHFVLGENNRKILLESGAADKNIILVDKKPFIHPEDYSHFYNKTFLLKCALEHFSKSDILFLDYDCSLLKDIDKKDIYNCLKNKKMEILVPPVSYVRKYFTSKYRGRLRQGLQTCLLYCKNIDIVDKWLEMYKSPFIHGGFGFDEAPLFLALEEIYGEMTPERIYSFDTFIIRTRRRYKHTELYNEENYKDAYFKHK